MNNNTEPTVHLDIAGLGHALCGTYEPAVSMVREEVTCHKCAILSKSYDDERDEVSDELIRRLRG